MPYSTYHPHAETVSVQPYWVLFFDHSWFHFILKERSVFLRSCGLLLIPFLSIKRSLILNTYKGTKEATASRKLLHVRADAYTCSQPGKTGDFVKTILEPALGINSSQKIKLECKLYT